MGITITYKCDRCGSEQNNAEQMWYVGVLYYHVGRQPSLSAGTAKAIWCRKCLVGTGILQHSASDPKTNVPAKEPTLEERILAVVEGVIEQF